MDKKERIEQKALEVYPVQMVSKHNYPLDEPPVLVEYDSNAGYRNVWIAGYWAAINCEEWKELYSDGLLMGMAMNKSIETGKSMEP